MGTQERSEKIFIRWHTVSLGCYHIYSQRFALHHIMVKCLPWVWMFVGSIPCEFKKKALNWYFAASMLNMKHLGVRVKTGQNNVPTCGLLLSWASKLKIQLRMSVLCTAGFIHYHSFIISLSEFSWKFCCLMITTFNESLIFIYTLCQSLLERVKTLWKKNCLPYSYKIVFIL